MSHAPSPLCLACNYPLKGIESRCCPECGRAFDLADPNSVNFGRPLGHVGRALIKHVGWPMMLVALAALVGLGWVTRWPGFWPTFWFGDARGAMGIGFSKTRVDDFISLNSTDRLFVAAVGVWWLAVFWFVFREGVRQLVLIIKRPGKLLRPPVWRRRIMGLALLGLGMLVIGFGWPYRMAVRQTAESLKGQNSVVPPLWPPNIYKEAREEKQIQIVHAQVGSLGEPHARLIGLRDLIHWHCESALPILLDCAARETDSNIRAAEIHLIGLHRDPSTADALLKYFDSADAQTRAAAIDAIGIIYSPAYPIPNGDNGQWSGGELRTDPSIEVRNIITLVNQRIQKVVIKQGEIPPLASEAIAMPAEVRQRLTNLMQNAPTSEEREATARAMLNQPPAGYKLRYAEWGVWLGVAGDSKLHTPDIEAEIPPFVHRMGNTAASLVDHVRQRMIIINKPVIHLTASAVMSVDLETRIHFGRPWFAYPKPDDFSVGVESRDYGKRGGLMVEGSVDPAHELSVLDKATFASLADAREGYPWLLPAHRERDAGRQNSYSSLNFIKALGVRWQSLIVSPQKLSWMTPPAVPDDVRLKWWSRLRDVDCSWVSSRGESERFLYYDGPTLAPAICDVALSSEKLYIQPIAAPALHGIVIEVKGDQVVATTVRIPGKLTLDVANLRTQFKPDARGQLQGLLVQSGLTNSEATGLIDCWTPQFFKTDGLRFIAVFGTETYSALCPMDIRPTPTERARVGLQLTELKAQ